jgi:hypothetical protein
MLVPTYSVPLRVATDHWPQPRPLGDAEGQSVLGVGVNNSHDIRPRREDRGMNEKSLLQNGR